MAYRYSRMKGLLRRRGRDTFNPNSLTEEDFIRGITINAKYVGCLEIERPMSRVQIVAAMRRVRFEYRTKKIKKKSVTLRVSVDGVEVVLKNKKKHLLDSTVSHHSISRIFYVSHDSQDLKVFSYITSDAESRVFHCSVFKSFKKQQAIQVVKTIGRAFDVCHRGDESNDNTITNDNKNVSGTDSHTENPDNDNHNNNEASLKNKNNNNNDVTSKSTISPVCVEMLKEDTATRNIYISQQQQQQQQQQQHQQQQQKPQHNNLCTSDYSSSITLPRSPNLPLINFSHDYSNNPFHNNINNNINNNIKSDSLKSADKYKIFNADNTFSSSFVLPSPITSSIPTSLDHLQLLTPSKQPIPSLLPPAFNNHLRSHFENFHVFQLQQNQQQQQHQQQQQKQQLQQQLQLLLYNVQELKSLLELESSKRIEAQLQLEDMVRQNQLMLKQLLSQRTSFLNSHALNNNNLNKFNNNINKFSNDDDSIIIRSKNNNDNNMLYKRGSHNDSLLMHSPSYKPSVLIEKMNRSFNNDTPSFNSTPSKNNTPSNNYAPSHNNILSSNISSNNTSYRNTHSSCLDERDLQLSFVPRDRQEKDFFEILQRYNNICNSNKNNVKRNSSDNNKLNYNNFFCSNINNRYNNPLHPSTKCFDDQFNHLYDTSNSTFCAINGHSAKTTLQHEQPHQDGDNLDNNSNHNSNNTINSNNNSSHTDNDSSNSNKISNNNSKSNINSSSHDNINNIHNKINNINNNNICNSHDDLGNSHDDLNNRLRRISTEDCLTDDLSCCLDVDRLNNIDNQVCDHKNKSCNHDVEGDKCENQQNIPVTKQKVYDIHQKSYDKNGSKDEKSRAGEKNGKDGRDEEDGVGVKVGVGSKGAESRQEESLSNGWLADWGVESEEGGGEEKEDVNNCGKKLCEIEVVDVEMRGGVGDEKHEKNEHEKEILIRKLSGEVLLNKGPGVRMEENKAKSCDVGRL